MIMKQGARTDLAQIRAMLQRAMIAARMANVPEGRLWVTASIEAVRQTSAAMMLNVSRRSVQSVATTPFITSPKLRQLAQLLSGADGDREAGRSNRPCFN
jgi:hypothetical protein